MQHTAVLLKETIDALQLAPGKRISDFNLGGGGHAREVLRLISPGGDL